MVANVTGWNTLFGCTGGVCLIEAPFQMFNSSMQGWVIGILFIVYQFMLYRKTQNITLCFTTGMLFVSFSVGLLAATGQMNPSSFYVMGILLVLEGAGILYQLLVK